MYSVIFHIRVRDRSCAKCHEHGVDSTEKTRHSTPCLQTALIRQNGCIACHNGPGAGGTSLQKMGLVKACETDNPAVGVSGNEADRYKFKVPLLRNVDMTYPYFHDGDAGTLTEAMEVMAQVQLGKELTAEEAALIVAFMKTQTGEQPSFALPILPPSTENTPKPMPF